MSFGPSPSDLKVLWDFARPHTIIGSVLAVLSFYGIAAHESGAQDLFLLLITLGASLAVNVYVVGINQMSDVEIDRVNKPGLPLPSGRISASDAARVVAISAVLALGLAAAGGRWLFGTIACVFVMGTLYSLPPARLKRFPVFAAVFIVLARGVIGNLGLWLTFAVALSGVAYVPGHLIAFVGFMIGFMTAISLMKDVPDVEGDARHDVRTFSVRAGPGRMLAICVSILSVFYAGMILLGLVGAPGLHGGWTVSAHVALLGALQLFAKRVDAKDRVSVAQFYRRVWGLYYLEFGVYVLGCLAA